MAVMIATRRPLLGGVGYIVLAAFALALGDGLIKIVGAHLSVWQLVFLRSLIALPVLVLLIAPKRAVDILPKRWSWVALRSLLLMAMWLAVYIALTGLPMPTVSAALYTAPLWIVLASALVPGRRLARAQIGAVGLGFVGTLLLLGPGMSGTWQLLALPLAGALCYALAAWITATRCEAESPLVLSLGLNTAFLLAGIAGLTVFSLWPAHAAGASAEFVLAAWRPVAAADWPRMGSIVAGLAALMIVANTAMARAYQIGPAPVVAAGDYSYLAFSGLWSLLLFGTPPSFTGVLGIALIVAGGLWAARSPVHG
ncbi:DMT family transporter [Salinisphaera sp. T31B1]|uniref:DMT family transporter n=1 Tax=Salinisphaera sp. T31B1 TaxID=727963 RepID=UPI003342D2C6